MVYYVAYSKGGRVYRIDDAVYYSKKKFLADFPKARIIGIAEKKPIKQNDNGNKE